MTGYTFADTELHQHDLINLNWGYAADDLLCTTADLSQFSHALMQGNVLNKAHLYTLLSPMLLNNKVKSQGSFTYSIVPIWNINAISASGSKLGYSSRSIYLPDSEVFVIVLVNSDGVNGGSWITPETVPNSLAVTFLGIS